VGPAIDPMFTCTPITNEAGAADYPWYWTSASAVAQADGTYAFAWYVAFGRAVGADENDLRGAGAVRFDAKVPGQPGDAVLLLDIKSGLQTLHGPGGERPPARGRAESSGPGQSLPNTLPPPPTTGANPSMSAPVPPDAEVLHDGPCITLVRIAWPPAGGRVVSRP